MTSSRRAMIVLKEGLSCGLAAQQFSINDRNDGSQSAGIGGLSP